MNVQVRDTPSGDNVAARLRKARDAARYTRQQLADLTGIPAKSIEKFENDDQEPSVSRLLAICEALGVSTDDILGKKPSGGAFPSMSRTPPASTSDAPIDPVQDFLEQLDDLRAGGFRDGQRVAMALAGKLTDQLHFLEPAALVDIARQRGVHMDTCPSALDLQNAIAANPTTGQAACAEVEQRIVDTALLGGDLLGVELGALGKLAGQLNFDAPFFGWSDSHYPALAATLREPLRQLAFAGKPVDLSDDNRFPARS